MLLKKFPAKTFLEPESLEGDTVHIGGVEWFWKPIFEAAMFIKASCLLET